MAMELYNSLSKGGSSSAGTVIDGPERTLADRPGARNAILVMDELGVDMRNNERTELTRAMLSNFDKVVVMADPDTIPAWLSTDPRYEYWEIEDPKGQSIEKVREIRNQILKHVNTLLEIQPT